MYLDLLKKLAEECEIDLIGIVDLNLLDEIKSTLPISNDEALAFYSGSFSDRTDITKAWHNARGVISFALSYNTKLTDNAVDSDCVRISKASFGTDYHKVLKAKAETLMDKFCEVYECQYKVFVDTGVLSDRLLAYCAGIGFYGKNHFIINEKFGSFIFLGHILTDIELNNKVTAAECKCGECDKCIKACPCGAYDNDISLNYSKCISYLNQKGWEYPKTNYIYGCDICQNVCVFNKNAPKDIHEEFYDSIDNVIVKIDDIMDMSKEDFDLRYSSKALAWRGLKNLKKNCKTILNRKGNWQ